MLECTIQENDCIYTEKEREKKEKERKIKKKEEVKREANLESSLDLPVGFAGPKKLCCIPNLHG